jgi:hypothetical protein
MVGFPAKMVARRVSEGRRTTEFSLAYASGYQKVRNFKTYASGYESAQLQNLRMSPRNVIEDHTPRTVRTCRSSFSGSFVQADQSSAKS